MGFDKLATELAGRPVLAHTLAAFQACESIAEIVVVSSPERFDFIQEVSREESITKLASVVEGGAERHLSVWNGILSCESDPKMIAVHDGARPLVTPAAITRCVAAAAKHEAAALAHRITDTLKRADPETGNVTGSVDRENLWAMETPQVFAASLLRAAYEKVLAEGDHVTDEVSAVEQLDATVRLVENPEANPKITFPGDIAIAEALLAAQK